MLRVREPGRGSASLPYIDKDLAGVQQREEEVVRKRQLVQGKQNLLQVRKLNLKRLRRVAVLHPE